MISDKHLNLYLIPHVLKKEDDAVDYIKNKLTNKRKEEFYTQLFKDVQHDVIRYQRMKQQLN